MSDTIKNIQQAFISDNNIKTSTLYIINITCTQEQRILFTHNNILEVKTSIPDNKVETVEFYLDSKTLDKIITGDITLQLAYMTGKLNIIGNLITALQFNQLFDFRSQYDS